MINSKKILQNLQTNLYFWTVNDNYDTATKKVFVDHVSIQKLFGKNLKLPETLNTISWYVLEKGHQLIESWHQLVLPKSMHQLECFEINW